MVNITYKIIMKTPMGKKNGFICLYENCSELCGFIDILGHRCELTNIILTDKKCSFNGELITPMRIIEFYAHGKANKKKIFLHIKAGKNLMRILGETQIRIE